MNFKVFFRTLFLIALMAAVAFTVYANIALPDKLSRAETEATEAVEDSKTKHNGNENINNDVEKTAIDNQPEDAAGNNVVDGAHNEDSVSRSYVKENVKVVISALGDVALGQDSRFNYTDSFDYVYEKLGGDQAYFLSGVVDILSRDDLTIANLETTLYDGNDKEKAEKYDYGNNYWFIGKPEYSGILKAGSIEAANLANNHTYDYGPKGYEATKKALDDAGIKHFGYSDALYMEIKGIKVGMAGFNQLGEYEQGLDMDVFKREVKEMTLKLRGECDLVIVGFHWGKEYKYQQEALQQELARLAIDSGADLVIGHHPHVLQPIEVYRGKYIAYSLGNFCFGGNKKPKDFDTAIFSQSFTFDSDNVLQHISEPVIIPCLLSSQKDHNNYKPMVAAEPAQKKRIYEKLGFMDFLSEEEKAGIAGKTDMVRLDAAIKDIVIDLKYATSDNIAGRPVYGSNTAYLRKGTADKLKKANDILMEHGFRIKVWDAYRKQEYHQELYESAEDKYYFMDPKIGSNHTRGAAVDVTLVDMDGNEVDMPSGFDEMSEKAHRTYAQATPEQKKNALLLENTMKNCGFIPLQKEWWHFDDSEYKTYEMLPEYPANK
jgi:D-alanyl-D-alanine dipeptidase